MAIRHANDLLSHLHGLALRPDGAGVPDNELLEQFLHRREDTAFEALVRRHGPMVLGVCRRVLRNDADAEDAFQATFLVLVRKADSIRPRDAVGNWLYGVAYRTAMKARSLLARRQMRERQITPLPERGSSERHDQVDLSAVLDQELERLPVNYRSPLVLCELQGLSRTEAARQLKIPEGTLSSRLARGRALLARRLTRRGITLSLGAAATLLAKSTVSACPPGALVNSTIQAATAVVAGHTATGLVSARVAALTEGVIQTMLLNKLKSCALMLLLLGFLGFGSVALLWQATAQEVTPVSKRGPDGLPAINLTEQDKKDHELLQGKWLPVQVIDGGRVVDKKELNEVTVIFTKKKMIFVKAGRKDVMTYKLNSRKSPKWIDITGKHKANQGIYELKGDTLKIVIDETGTRGRPTAFVSVQNSVNDLLMVFKRAPEPKKNTLPKGKNKTPKSPRAKTGVVPLGAVALQLDKAVQFNVQSNSITINGQKFSLISIGRGTFQLSDKHRLTGKLHASVMQYSKVDYWIYAAVFDRQGRLLGTTSHKEPVEYIRTGVVPTIFRDIELDFGISNAFRRAAFVVVTISERDVPKPGSNTGA